MVVLRYGTPVTGVTGVTGTLESAEPHCGGGTPHGFAGDY